MEQESYRVEDRNARQRYIEILFDLNPDDEMLARMWEMDPETMSRLMPEIGNESEAKIDSELSKPKSHMNFALNSLRVVFGREIKLTPRQRMREAKVGFDEESVLESAGEPVGTEL